MKIEEKIYENKIYDIEYIESCGCEVIKETRHYIHALRPDGLNVFFDKNTNIESVFLNNIRMNGSKIDVIQAVGIVRGYQIALNYAESQNVKLPSIELLISNQLRTINKSK